MYRGVWSRPSTDSVEEEEVAVKTIENRSSEEDRVKLLQEAAIMGQFNHPNIVKILGTIIDEKEVLCVCIDLVLAWTGLCVFQNARIAIFGASLSEPHTSELVLKNLLRCIISIFATYGRSYHRYYRQCAQGIGNKMIVLYTPCPFLWFLINFLRMLWLFSDRCSDFSSSCCSL